MDMQTLRLSQAVDLFLRSILAGDNSIRTVETYRDMLAKFVAFMEDRGCHSLGDVQAPDIREWLIFKKQQGISSAHLYNCYRIPRRFWNWCLSEEYVDYDPFARVAKPKAEQQVKQALSDDQIKALLKACEGRHWLMRRDRALILLLLGTGLRIQECHQLRVCDVQGNSVLVHGKGKKQRVVPLPPQASLAIHKYLASCPYRPGQEDPLWWGNAGRITLDGLKQAVRAVGERAGMKLGPHMFRRTFATKLLAAGVSMEHVRLLMGHSDYGVLRQYLHLAQSDLEEAIRKYNPLNGLK
jgi:site-specific recombinase XerD